MSSLITQNLSQLSTPQVIDNHITVKTASEISGYNVQYLRRLFRASSLETIKIGQVWLINLVSLEDYLRSRMTSNERRCSGRKFPCEQEVEEATSVMLNRIGDIYQRIAGGALRWDCIILTGGGSGLL